MAEQKMVKCGRCGKEVPDYDIDRWEDCGACRAEERASDMCVGDLNK